MAHFAELDSNNVVIRVIVVSNDDCSDVNGVEKESIGIAHCEKHFGGRWVQTSYNANFRKNYAGIGHTYNAELDQFVPPKPDNVTNWVYNEQDAKWMYPLPYPEDMAFHPDQEKEGKKFYVWNAEANTWDVLQTVLT